MNDNLGNPLLVGAAAQMLSTPEGAAATADIMKEARKTATVGIRTIGVIILTPIALGVGFVAIKSISKAIESRRKDQSQDNYTDNNQQKAINFRDALLKKMNWQGNCTDENEILKIARSIKYKEDWEEIKNYYSTLYKGKKGFCDGKNILDESGTLYNDIHDLLSSQKYNTFMSIFNSAVSKNSTNVFYVKSKKNTEIFIDFRGSLKKVKDFPKHHTIKSFTYEKQVNFNGENYLQFKKGWGAITKHFIIPYNDVLLITRADYEQLINSNNYVEI